MYGLIDYSNGNFKQTREDIITGPQIQYTVLTPTERKKTVVFTLYLNNSVLSPQKLI